MPLSIVNEEPLTAHRFPRQLSEPEFNAIRDRLLDEAQPGLSEQEFHRWIPPRLEDRLLAFEGRYEQTAKPFQWTFNRVDPADLLAKLKAKELDRAA